MVNIHPTAIIDGDVELSDGVVVEAGACIRGPARIGPETVVRSYAVVEPYTTVGRGCVLFPHAVVGGVPQDLKFAGEETTCVIGDNTVVREFVTISRGTNEAGTTKVGSGCLLMAYAHVAHDCFLGDGVVLSNCVQLAGHIKIDDYATVGGLTAIHQFVSIGRLAFVGGTSRITQDVVPYALIASEPTRVAGVNMVGLQRHGFSEQSRDTIKKAFSVLFRENLNTTQALDRLEREFGAAAEIRVLAEFVKSSRRGILR